MRLERLGHVRVYCVVRVSSVYRYRYACRPRGVHMLIDRDAEHDGTYIIPSRT